MDYKKAAQELFEMLLGQCARHGETGLFAEVCAKYPELLAEYEDRVEEEAKDIVLPDAAVEEIGKRIEELIESAEDEEKEKNG